MTMIDRDKIKSGNLIKELGIESLSDEQKARILDQAVVMVEQRLLLRLMKSLDDAKREQLTGIMSRNSVGELDQFIAQECPSFVDWVAEETEAIHEELKAASEIE